MAESREVRLRQERAEHYPEIRPGMWLLAGEVAATLVRRARAARRLSIHQRTLDPAHFEFRGGAPLAARPPGSRTRVTDRPFRRRGG